MQRSHSIDEHKLTASNEGADYYLVSIYANDQIRYTTESRRVIPLTLLYAGKISGTPTVSPLGLTKSSVIQI